MEIDHVFLMVDPPGDRAAARLAELGLEESYRRQHPGQGTENVCYCFDNLYLELLWISDPDEAAEPAIRRTGLVQRAGWQENGANPFGIAWRSSTGAPNAEITTWAYSPPYLPAGVSIPVSVDSDDHSQPLLFRSPGTSPPIQWPAERQGNRQSGAGLTTVRDLTLEHPSRTPYCATLQSLAANTDLHLSTAGSDRFRLALRIDQTSGAEPRTLLLPDLIWRETRTDL